MLQFGAECERIFKITTDLESVAASSPQAGGGYL
jgi:hypothetical protein